MPERQVNVSNGLPKQNFQGKSQRGAAHQRLAQTRIYRKMSSTLPRAVDAPLQFCVSIFMP